MTIYLKQSTASQEVPFGPFVDETDGKTAETGLTIANTDIKVWKTGATTLADKNSGGATHISGGIYYAVFDATDTNTAGPIVFHIHVSGALPVRVEAVVLVANVYDSLIGGSDALQVHANEITNGLITAAAIATNAIDADAIAADAVTEIQSGLSTVTTAQVNAEVLDVLNVDTFAEPTGVPPATATLRQMLGFLYSFGFRNQKTVTATKKTYYDDGGASEFEKDLSDDGTTYTETESNAI